MFRAIRMTIVVVAILVIASSAWAAQTMYQGFPVVNVVVDGKPLVTDVPAVNLNGRTVLPLRAVAELVGMDVKWDQSSSTATLTSRISLDRTRELETENTTLKRDLISAKADLENARLDLAALQKQLKEAQAELTKLKQPQTAATTPTPTPPASEPTAFKSVAELKTYLQTNYSVISTAAGNLALTYEIFGPNDYNWAPYDYWVKMDWDPFTFFDDLESRISITPEMKVATITKLKDHAKLVYDLTAKTLPGKKLLGGYYTSWYKYPTIREGFQSRRYLSWQNYDGDALTMYADAKLSTFRFDPNIDNTKY